MWQRQGSEHMPLKNDIHKLAQSKVAATLIFVKKKNPITSSTKKKKSIDCLYLGSLRKLSLLQDYNLVVWMR